MSHADHTELSPTALLLALYRSSGGVGHCEAPSIRSRRRNRAQRFRRAAGAVVAVATGSVAVMQMGPEVIAARAVSIPVQLMSGSEDVLSAIDNLGVAEQQLTGDIIGGMGDGGNYSFVQTSDLSMLPEYVQTVAQTMTASQYPPLLASLGDVGIPYAPYAWDAPATNMQQFLILANADDQYSPLPIDASDTYKITVDPGPGTQDLSFTANSGNGVTESYQPLASYDLSQFTPNANGTYTIIVSDTPQQGNWIDSAGADRLIMRDAVGNWGLIHDNINFQQIGVPDKSVTPMLTDQQIASILDTTASNLVREAQSGDYFGQMSVPQTEVGVNEVTAINHTVPFMPGPLDKAQISSLGNYALQPDQALIVKVPDVDAAGQQISEYSSLMVSNTFGMSAPAGDATGMLNDTQVFQAPDGYTYYVIAAQNPDVANWVNDYGASHGEIWIRFQNLLVPADDILGDKIATQVVPIADVRQDLPSSTPTVTPEQYASLVQDRLLEWDYTHDQNADSAWLAANLINEQVEAAIGQTAYDQLLGGQGMTLGVPEQVPSVLDRIVDPALRPNIGTMVHDIFTDPKGSVIGWINNVPLAIKDVELPTLLALLSLKGALQLHTGIPGLATVGYNAFINPSTSIPAGFLNARDDLAVGVMNANPSTTLSDSAPLWDSLIQLNQQVLGSLVPPLPTGAEAAAFFDPAALGSLVPTLPDGAEAVASFDPTTLGSLAADLIPHAPLGLLP